jgi:hypothetical protein
MGGPAGKEAGKPKGPNPLQLQEQTSTLPCSPSSAECSIELPKASLPLASLRRQSWHLCHHNRHQTVETRSPWLHWLPHWLPHCEHSGQFHRRFCSMPCAPAHPATNSHIQEESPCGQRAPAALLPAELGAAPSTWMHSRLARAWCRGRPFAFLD